MNVLLIHIFCLFLTVNISKVVYSQPVKERFALQGKVTGISNGIIYLNYYINKEKKSINDSALINNEEFSFHGNISEPTVAFITLEKRGAFGHNSTHIFIEPSTMNVELKHNEFEEANLTGSITQKEYQDLRERSRISKETYKQQLYQAQDHEFVGDKDSLYSLLTPYFNTIKENENNFFSSHPKSFLTAYLLQYRVYDLPIDSLIFFYNRLGPELQEHIVSERIRQVIKQKKTGSVGSIANQFMTEDVNGNYVISRLIKGKYILLDFWATWCVPCRKNSPHLIKLYNLYKNKGLKIIGIADDRDTTLWKKAIQTDGTNIWTHVLRGANKEARLKGMLNESDLHEKYGVSTMPTLILINPEGIIIGRYEGELDKLDKMLATIFK